MSDSSIAGASCAPSAPGGATRFGRMFDERMGAAALGYVVAGPPHEQELRTRAGRRAREMFAAVWQSPSDPVFR